MSDEEVDELLKAVDTSSGEINYTGNLSSAHSSSTIIQLTQFLPQTSSEPSSPIETSPPRISYHQPSTHPRRWFFLSPSSMQESKPGTAGAGDHDLLFFERCKQARIEKHKRTPNQTPHP